MGAFQEFARAAMAAGTKRGRRPVMNAQQFYPRGLERELQQKTVAEFMRIYGQFLEAAMLGFSTFRDDQGDLSESQPVLSDAFKGELASIAQRTDRKARENFSRQSEMIIGAPYYPPGSTEWILNDWHATFQDLCVSACAQQKTKIAVIVAGAKQAGWNKYQLEKAIEKQLPSQFKHRAELIARTELAKLNTAVTLETYRSAGVQYYKWLTTIDGRERESHALMNDRICSVTDGDVYFEQNPKQPLRPIEHRRTGDMYHGHPGTDFQCRCSMVMWDPAIDGDYEVKDSDLLEQREAEELAEKEAQERAEAERKAKEQAELEKAAEALKTAKEAAKRAEDERQAAEKARQEAEENARKLAEEARAARLEAAAVKRHAERTEEMERAIVSAWNRRRILRNAEARHAERTQEQATAIQQRWDDRQAKIKEAIKTVDDIRGEYSGIKGLAFPSTVKKAESQGKYTKAAGLAQNFKAKVDAEASKLDLLAEPLEAMRKHGLKEAQAVQDAVRKKLEYLEQFDIDKKIKKLEFEIEYVEKNKKYATWEVAKKAYEKALAEVVKKAAEEAEVKIDVLASAAKFAKTKKFVTEVGKLQKLAKPTTKKELDDLNAKIDSVEQMAVKSVLDPKAGDIYNEVSFKPSTAKQRNAARFIDSGEWKSQDASLMPNASAAWRTATLEQKQAAYYYTQGSKVNNEPLYGAHYYSSGKDVMEAVTKHNPNLTRFIDSTSLPQDTWLRSGQKWGTFSGVFGIDLEAEINALNNGKRSNDDIANALTKKLKGKTGTQKAFMSTSFASDTGFLKEDLEFHIFSPKGTKCLYAEPFSHFGARDTSPTEWDGKDNTITLGTLKEFEGILQRGTGFKIIGFEYGKDVRSNTKWRVLMEIVRQAPKPYQPGNPVTY